MSLRNLKKKNEGDNVEENKMNIEIYVDMLEELVENNRKTIEISEDHETEEFITEYIFLEDNVTSLLEKLPKNEDNSIYTQSVLEGKFSSYTCKYRMTWSIRLQTFYNKRKKFMDENATDLSVTNPIELSEINESATDPEKDKKSLSLNDTVKDLEISKKIENDLDKRNSEKQDFIDPTENNCLKEYSNFPENGNSNDLEKKDDQKPKEIDIPEEKTSLRDNSNIPKNANSNPLENKEDKKPRDCCCILF